MQTKTEDGAKKTGEELDEVKDKAGQAGKVVAQMDDKFNESVNNMVSSITELVAKMDQMYDEGVKISGIFDGFDGERPPWADWFKETTGQAGIEKMEGGLKSLIESFDTLNSRVELTAKLLAAIAGVDLNVDAAKLQKALDSLTLNKQVKPAEDAESLKDAVEGIGNAADTAAQQATQAGKKISDVMVQTTKETQKLDKQLNVVSGRVVGLDASGNKVTATTDKDGNVTGATVEKINLDAEFEKLLKLKKDIDDAYAKLVQAIESGNANAQAKAQSAVEKAKASMETQFDRLMNVTGSTKEFISEMNSFRRDYAASVGEWENKIAGADEGKLIDQLKVKLKELYALQEKAVKEDKENEFAEQIKAAGAEVEKLKDSLKDIIPAEAMADIDKLEAELKQSLDAATVEATFKKMEAAIKSIVKAQNDLQVAEKNGDEYGENWARARVQAAQEEFEN